MASYVAAVLATLSGVSASLIWVRPVKRLLGYAALRWGGGTRGVILFATLRQLFSPFVLSLIVVLAFVVYLHLTTPVGAQGVVQATQSPSGEISGHVSLSSPSPSNASLLAGGFFFALFAGIFASRLYDRLASFAYSKYQDIAEKLLSEFNQLLCGDDKGISQTIGKWMGPIFRERRTQGIVNVVEAMRKKRSWWRLYSSDAEYVFPIMDRLNWSTM